MGVRVTITCFATGSLARDACAAAFARFEELDDVMSDFRPSSELMRLCARSGQGLIEISPDLHTVLARAQDDARLSGGALDVTCGPLTHLWRRARTDGSAPTVSEIAAARKLVGYGNLILGEGSAELRLPGMVLDLGGIGKGYACGEALRVLSEMGIESAMVEAGGDIAMSGAPPGMDGWRIEVALKPRRLSNCAISTSGDAEQHLDIDGRTYSHVIDPRTGTPLVDSRQVTVLAPDAMTADSLTKVCAVMGVEASQPILWRYDARLIGV